MDACIGVGQFDEVEQEIAEAEPDDPNAIKLKLALIQAKIAQIQRAIVQKQLEESAGVFLHGIKEEEAEDSESDSVQLMTTELKDYSDELAELVEKLLPIEPNAIEQARLAAICKYYISEGKTSQASNLVNRYLGYFPDSKTGLFYKRILSEPEPDKVSEQRRRQIEKEVLLSIADPATRAMELGAFYHRQGQLDKAAAEFKKVLGIDVSPEDIVARPAPEQTEKIADLQRAAAGYLFETALEKENWELAAEVAEAGRRENIDDCEGNFFAARFAMAKKQYKVALTRIDECLRQRPVFSHGFIVRGNINAALGNEQVSIEDAQKAASLNPLDGTIAKVLANALYQRNQRLGDNASPSQIIETRNALRKAMWVNPGDLQLLSFYAEYISSTEPLTALAIRQNLQRNTPSMENAILLGKLATRLAVEETAAERREELFDIAASAFQQAQRYDPNDKAVLYSYAEYYRAKGQVQKAEQLLLQSEDQELLWDHYLQSGRFEDANRVLQQAYKSGAKDNDVLRGLLFIARREDDEEAVKKYSEELLSLEDSVENRLIQIQTFLNVGLIKEAEYKLQSFKERHPHEPRALLLEASFAMRQGQLEKALELTNRRLETDQDNAVAWRIRGEVNLFMTNYNQAIIDLNKSKSLSDEPVTRISLAKAYWQAGRVEDAITELRSAADNPQAPMESGILLERLYRQLDRKKALKRFYDRVLEKFPDNIFWYNQTGAFAIEEGNLDRAEQLFRQAWQKGQEKDRAMMSSLDGYLQALLLGGKLDKVLQEAGEYVDSRFAPIAYSRMAEAKLKLGDRETAIQYCRKAVDKAGTDRVAFASEVLRRMYSMLGAEELLRYCKERLEDDPDSLVANLTMFNLMKIRGDYNKDVDYIDKCIEIAGSDNLQEAEYMMRKAAVLALAYEKTSDNNYFKAAIAEYESLIAKMPNNTDALNNLAYMLAESDKRLVEALEYAKQAHEARPNNPNILDTYAYVLYKNGRFSEAAEFLQAALQQYEQNNVSVPMVVYEHLGMIKEQLGAGTEALTAYKQALKAGTDEMTEPVKQRIEQAIERLSP
jgi:tetratricopeptide (TPR) repeat protein